MNVQKIGKLERNKLGEFKDKLLTEDVVLTKERIEHIRKRHPRRLRELWTIYKNNNRKTRLYFKRQKQQRYNLNAENNQRKR